MQGQRLTGHDPSEQPTVQRSPENDTDNPGPKQSSNAGCRVVGLSGVATACRGADGQTGVADPVDRGGTQMSVEENKRVLAEFEQLLGADDLTPLDRLCRPTW